VVLIAGHGSGVETWGPLERALLEHGRRVLAIDRRFEGASDFPAHGQRMARQGADVHEFLTAQVGEPAVLVGLSMGVCAIWAMIDLFGTAGLRGLVLMDQSPKVINDRHWKLGVYGVRWPVLNFYVATFGSTWARRLRLFQKKPVARYAEEVLPMLAAQDPSYPHRLVRPLMLDHVTKDWRDVLPRIDVPTLAIAGRHSELFPPEHAAFIAQTVPNAEARVFEHSGHVPMLSEPAALCAAVTEFTDRIV
jgi:pimeloyl-ACP methyl ester carboxylesterase